MHAVDKTEVVVSERNAAASMIMQYSDEMGCPELKLYVN